jgi:hypothetical protein
MNPISKTPPKTIKKVNNDQSPIDEINFVGCGANEAGDRFLRVSVRGKRILLKFANLRQPQLREYELLRLERLGIPIAQHALVNELVRRAEKEARKEPSFHVATRIGWTIKVVEGKKVHVFVLPKRTVPEKAAGVEIFLDHQAGDIHSRFITRGTLEGAKKLFGMFKGNSRLITCAVLAFVGPMSAAEDFEHVGLQLTGPSQSGKTLTLKVVSSIWGWADQHDLGFGVSWNSTRNALERTFSAFRQTFAAFDEAGNVDGNPRSRAAFVLNAAMLGAQGEGKARFTDSAIASWFSPLMSTSNVSVVSMLRMANLSDDERFAYIDRLIDIPPPEGGLGFLEDLRGFSDLESFFERAQELAKENAGRAGPAFAFNLARALDNHHAKVVAFTRTRQGTFMRAAAGISSPGRNLARVHGKFATIYAAGCLAIYFKILPFSEEELLEAILKCDRDHVAFIARETGGLASNAESPIDRLRRYGEAKESCFVEIDGSTNNSDIAQYSAADTVYMSTANGCIEYWFPNELFERIAGGKKLGDDLKRLLLARRQLVTEARGRNISYVVKRQLPGSKERSYFVVVLPKGSDAPAKAVGRGGREAVAADEVTDGSQVDRDPRPAERLIGQSDIPWRNKRGGRRIPRPRMALDDPRRPNPV